MSLDPITAVSDLVTTAITRFFPDADTKVKEQFAAEVQLITVQATSDQMQAQIDAEDAKSEHWFQWAWRPGIGWVCGVAFAWNYVLQPFLSWGVNLFGGHVPLVPTLDLSDMMPVLLGLLGLGGLRTYEKVSGVHR